MSIANLRFGAGEEKAFFAERIGEDERLIGRRKDENRRFIPASQIRKQRVGING
jgi:hypothetical protein